MQRSQREAGAPNAGDADDAQSIARAAAGDATAFEPIMRRHNRLLFRTVRSILKDDTEAEDALQDAWLRAWRALDSFRADAKLSTWLVRIAANEALARRRRNGAQVVPIDAALLATDPDTITSLTGEPDQQPERIAMRAQLRQLMEARIDLLPEVFRSVFMLRAVEEMSVEDVAAALDIPEATVRSRLFRARSLLREGLAQEVDIAVADAFSFDGARCDRIVAGVLARIGAEQSPH
ncbi:MAG: RNA polymerase sigma factor [Proteobacteria bacterium]|nr:RNA polymerase sigma factor [Pseudomonadota bacterium]